MDKNSTKLLRRLLASLDIDDLEKYSKELTLEEASQRAKDADVFYERHFKRMIVRWINAQLLQISNEVNNKEQLFFGRGTMNGFKLIEEWFREQVAISRAIPSEDDSDKPRQPLPDL